MASNQVEEEVKIKWG